MALTNLGKPSTDNYLIGRGVLRLDLFDTSGNATGLYRDLGNATDFNLTLDEETLEHQSSLSGLKVTDASVTLSKSLTGGFVLDEITKENREIFFSATLAEVTQASQDIDGDDNYSLSSSELGYWLPLYNSASNLKDSTQARLRFPNIELIQVGSTMTDSGATLVEGTDYDVDNEAGLIIFYNSAAMAGYLANDDPLLLDVDWESDSLNDTGGDKASAWDAQVLERTVVRGRLLFVGENAATGKKYEVFLNRVKIEADGDASAIGDDFSNLSFQFTAEKDEAFDSTASIGKITELPL